jgi:ribosomal protein L25 (general stress protein Ctc)
LEYIRIQAYDNKMIQIFLEDIIHHMLKKQLVH